jgi:hypothetical protein
MTDGSLPSRELSREMLDSSRSTPGKATKSNVNPTVSSRIPGQNEQGIGFGRAGNLINEQGKRITRPAQRAPWLKVDEFSHDGQATGPNPTPDRRAVPDRHRSDPITAVHLQGGQRVSTLLPPVAL